jgi:hypothetical protein
LSAPEREVTSPSDFKVVGALNMRKKLAFEIFVLLLLSDLSIKKMNNTHKKD